MTITNLTLIRRRNRDQSITFTARWTEAGEGGRRFGCRKLARTGAKPLRDERNKVARQARGRLATIEQELGLKAVEPRRVVARWLMPQQVVERYLMWSEQNEAPATYLGRVRACRAFMAFIRTRYPKKKFRSLSVKHVSQFRAWRLGLLKSNGKSRNPNSVRAEMMTLRDLWKMAKGQGYCKANVARKAKLPHAHAASSHVPETELVLQVIREADTPLKRAALYLLAATGMRQGELRGLRVEHWDRTARLLRIPSPDGPRRRQTKRHQRDVPIGPGGERVLAELAPVEGGPLLVNGEGKALGTQINAWLKPYRVTPHDLRRWFYTRLSKAKAPPYIIAHLVGHAIAKSEAPYVPDGSACLEDLRAAIMLVESLLAPALEGQPTPPGE